MSNVMLGGIVEDTLGYRDRAIKIHDLHSKFSLGSGKYAQLAMLEQDINRFINSVGYNKLNATVEGRELIVAYNSLAKLEASERAISSQHIIDRQKTAEAKKAAKESEQAKKDVTEAKRAKNPELTARVDTGTDVLKPEGGFGIGAIAIAGVAGLGIIFFLKRKKR